ncbi:cobalt-precorrin-6A reductase [Roseobacteraceae bacterium S113]
MAINLLLLGGTTEATALAQALDGAGITATLSFAGRVARPKRQPLPTRVGGFGGVSGLADYLLTEGITHVIDATHPFAAQMSHNAVAACTQTGVALSALTRAAWKPQYGDDWTRVTNIAGAVAALDRPALRVMLAVGRMHLAEFAPNPQHEYLLRLIDPPEGALPLPKTQVVLDRGPFSEAGDLALMRGHKIELVVSKNSGGTGAYGKIAAARALGLPVIMIDRPALPARHELHSVAAVMGWLGHGATNRGV